jgi:phosphoribosylformylglycinamidine synthase
VVFNYRLSEKAFEVLITIENKNFINDPEGETILQDLVLKGGYFKIKSVRIAKVLKLQVNAKNSSEASKLVKKMCDELRLFNPIVSNCDVTILRKKE